MAEILLRGAPVFPVVQLGVNCKVTDDAFISCSVLGESILVMAGRGRKVCAALVRVAGGPLVEGSCSVTELTVKGRIGWHREPFLAGFSERQALLYFAGQRNLWRCTVNGTDLVLEELATRSPPRYGFVTVPLCLPEGKLVVAGSLPCSTDITVISLGEEPVFQKASTIPTVKASHVSTVLVRDRFLIGFGGLCGLPELLGRCQDDLWIADLRTGLSSGVRRKGAWHPRAYLTPLAVQGDVLCLLGGSVTRAISSIPLSVLASLILNPRVRRTFRAVLNIPTRLKSVCAGSYVTSFLPYKL